MGVRKFIGRDRELDILRGMRDRKGFKLLPIYGRRRIGKTALLKRFMGEGGGLYFLCTTAGTRKNLRYLSAAVGDHLGMPPLETGSFREVFSVLASRSGEGLVVALDEFPYLISKDEGLLGEFQYIVDEILSKTGIMLILCGSSVSMMENYVLSGKSPLFGRRTGQLELGGLSRCDVRRFVPGLNFAEALAVESAVGGVPRYLMEFEDERDIFRAMERSFFSSDGYLYREAYLLLHDELREPDSYMNILESMARGKTRLSEIAQASYIPAKDMSKYLGVLGRLGLVRRIQPVTDRRPASKKSIYVLCDPYFRFWFRFVLPNRADIEFARPEVPVAHVREKLGEHVSAHFEDVVREAVAAKLGYSRVGRWWHGGEEIDVVGIDEDGGRYIACEVKWSKRKVGPGVADDLGRKAGLIREAEGREMELMVVSRSGFTKKALELMDPKGIRHWDLHDLEEMV